MNAEAEKAIFDASLGSAAPVTDGSAVMSSNEFAPVTVDAASVAPGVPVLTPGSNEGVPAELGATQTSEPQASGFTSAIRKGAAAVMSFVPSDVNQRFETFRAEQSNSMKPWMEFVGYPNFKAAYALTSLKFIPARVLSNLKRYLWNYVAIFGITFAILAFVLFLFSFMSKPFSFFHISSFFDSVFHFSFFLVALGLIALWLYVFFWRSEPMVVFGQTLSYKIISIGLAVLSVGLCWLVLGNKFWFVVLADTLACIIHSVARQSVEEVVDFNQPTVV